MSTSITATSKKTLLDIIDTIHYKEGWSFSVNHRNQFLCTVIQTCSRTGLPITQHFAQDNWPEVCGNCASPEAYVYECIRKIELHEVGEWLIIGNERLYDPHNPECWRRHGQPVPASVMKECGGAIGYFGGLGQGE